MTLEANRVVPALDLVSHLPAMYAWTQRRVVQVLWLVKTCLYVRLLEPKNSKVEALFASFVLWLCEGRNCPTCAAEDSHCQAAFRELEEGIQDILGDRSLRQFGEFPWREYVPAETTPLNCKAIRPGTDFDELWHNWRGSDWDFAQRRVFRTEKKDSSV